MGDPGVAMATANLPSSRLPDAKTVVTPPKGVTATSVTVVNACVPSPRGASSVHVIGRPVSSNLAEARTGPPVATKNVPPVPATPPPLPEESPVTAIMSVPGVVGEMKAGERSVVEDISASGISTGRLKTVTQFGTPGATATQTRKIPSTTAIASTRPPASVPGARTRGRIVET